MKTKGGDCTDFERVENSAVDVGVAVLPQVDGVLAVDKSAQFLEAEGSLEAAAVDVSCRDSTSWKTSS